jgi:hypothetical protein
MSRKVSLEKSASDTLFSWYHRAVFALTAGDPNALRKKGKNFDSADEKKCFGGVLQEFHKEKTFLRKHGESKELVLDSLKAMFPETLLKLG